MPKRSRFAAGFLMSTILNMIGPVSAAEVTADRLINADKEPQNWLMNHRTYDAQRYSPPGPNQQGQRQRPQARLCRSARRYVGEREP
jgi:hypothetical protein